MDTGIKRDDTVGVITLKGELVMVGEAAMSTEEMLQKDTGVCIIPNRVIMKKGTYPKLWKKT